MTTTFEKRVKRRVTGIDHHYFAVCLPGLEFLCEEEIKRLFPENRTIHRIQGGVEFSGRLSDCYLANLHLRACSRILMRIGSFKAENFPVFEKKTAGIDWELFLSGNESIDCRVSVKKCRLYHSDALAQRVRNVIINRLTISGKSLGSPGQTVYIRGEHDRFTLSVDSSGINLYKRGIKKNVMPAPIRETIAWAVLAWAGYQPGDALLDPMCGSGTFSLEAAMVQSRIPPGFYRRFAFETWPAFSKNQFNYLKTQAESEFVFPDTPSIFSSDKDPQSMDVLKQNIKELPFPAAIQARQLDFFSINATAVPDAGDHRPGTLVLNPPYGHRIKADSSQRRFYQAIGSKLRQDFTGWKVGIIIPSKTLAGYLGLGLTLKPVFHGGLHLYAGTGRVQAC